VDEMCRLMTLTGNHVAQITFERWDFINDQVLEFFYNFRVVLYELIRKHKSRTPMIVLIFLITLFNHFQSSIPRDTARVVLKLLAVFSRTRSGQNQTANPFRIVKSNPLKHSRPHGVPHHVGFLDAERVHQTYAILGEQTSGIVDVRFVTSSQSPMVIDKDLIVLGKLRYLKNTPGGQANAGAGHQNQGISLAVKLVIEIHVIDFNFATFNRFGCFHDPPDCSIVPLRRSQNYRLQKSVSMSEER